jgi:glycosyltransferase involved in cell wall biosynthesis
MIEYLLSGTPVLTTRFAAMPEEYLNFVHLISQQTARGIAEAIDNVFCQPEDIRREMSRNAYNYVFVHHNYSHIVSKMCSFIDALE